MMLEKLILMGDLRACLLMLVSAAQIAYIGPVIFRKEASEQHLAFKFASSIPNGNCQVKCHRI